MSNPVNAAHIKPSNDLESTMHRMLQLACRSLIASAFLLAILTEFVTGVAPTSSHAQAQQSAPAPSSGGPVDSALLADLVSANHILTEQGVLDAFGHVSVRHPGNPGHS